MNESDLRKFEVVDSNTGLEVTVFEQCEELRRDDGERFCVAKDTALVVRNAEKCILIMQDMFPYNLLVSQDPTLIGEVMGSS